MKDKIIILKNHLKLRNIKIIKLKFKVDILNFKRCKLLLVKILLSGIPLLSFHTDLENKISNIEIGVSVAIITIILIFLN
jgi:hypothetical protein